MSFSRELRLEGMVKAQHVPAGIEVVRQDSFRALVVRLIDC
jgi:hypothetical protein